MTTFVVFNAAGVVLRRGRCPDDLISVQGSYEEHVRLVPEESPVSDDTHRYDFTTEQFVERPSRPSIFHITNLSTGEWEVDITEARRTVRESITAARDAEERAGFTAYGKLFDSNDKAITRISVAAQAATVAISVGMTGTRSWTCADDTSIELTYEQIAMLPVIMTEAADTLHVKARALKADIEAADTLDEILTITW